GQAPLSSGPFALGALALASDDPTARQAALEKGEELLRTGAVSHNHLLFPRDAIEVYLEAGNWDRVERSAAELDGMSRGFERTIGRRIRIRQSDDASASCSG